MLIKVPCEKCKKLTVTLNVAMPRPVWCQKCSKPLKVRHVKDQRRRRLSDK